MALIPLTVISFAAMWSLAHYGVVVAVQFFLGVAWTLTMIRCAGIPLGWLSELAKRVEDSGGSVFTRLSGQHRANRSKAPEYVGQQDRQPRQWP